ncbi:4a-hydroxytetrahydrobiopterin dehydratase [Gellertiella hungarica]|uniref:Putative pterin-4-alpha-carbinolamine dehydratase n=1 Tax=Gellertiella hungarica TaxID=1572859 RepID=A0A7W6NL67_9HYPH|nr:4a-hydroxytetrahydrobiopterin dehydratase [Gellertiella hungarica]MBB4065259.1 4a-hydroxytetrahydrobiopterin dehydratase [Gellertiella hungarica]
MVIARSRSPEYTVLDTPAVQAALESLPGWSLTENERAIRRCFRFRNFTDAFGFMTESALLAEKINHHPEWSNVYGTVDVVLTTHATGGITDHDVHMAVMMNRAAAKRGI